MIFIQDAEVTPAQLDWLRSASPLDGARFLHSAPIRILCLYVLLSGSKLERRFMPTVQGVRIFPLAEEMAFATPEDAQAAGEAVLAHLRQTFPPNELNEPLDIEALGLAAVPVDEFDSLDDLADIDVQQVLTEVEWQKRLTRPGKPA